MKRYLWFALAAAAVAAAPAYKVVNKIKIPVACAGITFTLTRRITGCISRTERRPKYGHVSRQIGWDDSGYKRRARHRGRRTTSETGFTSDGGDNDVTVFDLKTLAV